jgi:hypothetical protein
MVRNIHLVGRPRLIALHAYALDARAAYPTPGNTDTGIVNESSRSRLRVVPAASYGEEVARVKSQTVRDHSSAEQRLTVSCLACWLTGPSEATKIL